MKLNTVLGNEIRSEKRALGVLGAAEIIESSLQQEVGLRIVALLGCLFEGC